MLGNLDAGDETQRYISVEKAAKEYPVTALCKIFGVSRSGYYAYLKRKGQDRDQKDKALVQKVYEQYNGVYGYRQIQLFLLQDHGVWMNHKKVLRLMRQYKLLCVKFKYRNCQYKSYKGKVGKIAGTN